MPTPDFSQFNSWSPKPQPTPVNPNVGPNGSVEGQQLRNANMGPKTPAGWTPPQAETTLRPGGLGRVMNSGSALFDAGASAGNAVKDAAGKVSSGLFDAGQGASKLALRAVKPAAGLAGSFLGALPHAAAYADDSIPITDRLRLGATDITRAAGTAIGGIAGAGAGSVIPVAGTLAGGAVGGAAGDWAGHKAGNAIFGGDQVLRDHGYNPDRSIVDSFTNKDGRGITGGAPSAAAPTTQPTASVAAPTAQIDSNNPHAAANAAKLAASDAQNKGNQTPTPTNTLRGQSGTDMGGGVRKFVQNGKTLYSNVTDGSNDTLMNRGAPSAQNQLAMDGIQARQDQGDANYAAKRQYDAEVADAQALRGGGDLASRIARQGPNHAVASMLLDQQNKAVLRGQTLNYDATVQGHNMTRNSNIARLNYDMQKDRRDFDVGRSDHASLRSDKAFEQGQSADKAWNDHAHSLFQIKDDKGNSVPDTKTAADYTRTVDNTVAQMIPKLAQSKDPKDQAHAADLAKRGRAALDNEDKGNLQKWFATRQAHAASSGVGPFSGSGAVSDNLFDYATGKPTSTMAQDRTDYGGGRSVPNVDLRYGPNANHFWPNMGAGSTYLTPNNLRGN